MLGITCVSSCIAVEQVVANVARTCRANNVKVPIYKGAEFPIIEDNGALSLEENFFGKDGIGDAPNDHPKVIFFKFFF